MKKLTIRQFAAAQNTECGHEYVDLGLPSGTLWATCNVGANSPEEYGDYFAWGEITTKDQYSDDTYKWSGYEGKLTKYNTESRYGTMDNKTTLDPQDDIARINWGGKWRMPTDDEWTELRENCTWSWTADHQGTGIAGRVVTGPNGNSIFLPAAGCRRYSDFLTNAGYYGGYCSSSLCADYPFGAWRVDFDSGNVYRLSNDRYLGRSVRAVLKKIKQVEPLKCDTTHTECGHEYVDLGLPSGLKWATCNVGANSPEEYGDYFAWGETAPKDNYDWDTYKWATAAYYTEYDNWNSKTLTKYNTKSHYGTVDNKTTLDSEDDAAAVNWGGKWRMPTDAEWTELRENCTCTWNALNDVNGYEVKSKTNGNTIFFPAAGFRVGNLHNAGSYGYYWSGSLLTGIPRGAWVVRFNPGNVRNYNGRFNGLSVRPVFK